MFSKNFFEISGRIIEEKQKKGEGTLWVPSPFAEAVTVLKRL